MRDKGGDAADVTDGAGLRVVERHSRDARDAERDGGRQGGGAREPMSPCYSMQAV